MQVGDLICSERGRKSRRRQASLNGVVVSNALCSRSADMLNKRMMFVQSIFHNVCTEVRKQEGLRKLLFVYNKGKTSCLSPGGTHHLFYAVDESDVNRHVQNRTTRH